MTNYEKQVEQEAASIPISLYNCYRTVRHEKRGIATPSLHLIAFLMPHCPVTVVQRFVALLCVKGTAAVVFVVHYLPRAPPSGDRVNSFGYILFRFRTRH